MWRGRPHDSRTDNVTDKHDHARHLSESSRWTGWEKDLSFFCHGVYASEHTMHHWTPTYIASRQNTQQSVSTVMRPLTISCSTAHCTTTSDPDYCQLNQIYATRYMDPLHNCNEQPPTTCQPWTDVTRLSEVWMTKRGKMSTQRHYSSEWSDYDDVTW